MLPHHFEPRLAVPLLAERVLVPTANSEWVIPRETRLAVWCDGLCLKSLGCNAPVFLCYKESRKWDIWRANRCCYCCWLPEVAAGVLVRALPSSSSPGVISLWLDSSTELSMCPGPRGTGARLPGCCDSTIMSMCNCGKWHQFGGFFHWISGTENCMKTVVWLKLPGTFKLQNHCAPRL